MKPFDEDGAFAQDAPEAGNQLRRLAVRSAGMTIASGGVTLGIQMVATVVLARLISPRDFGLVAMVTTFSLLLSNFGLNGLTEAVVQRDKIDHTLASNLFWVSISGGILLTIGFAEAGPLLARFYGGELAVAKIAAWISTTIFLTSTSVLHLGLLKRAMRFSAVARIDIVARTVSVVVSIAFGWAGWGFWALVLGACVLPLSTTIGAWMLCQWVPGRPRYAAGTGTMLRYAMNTYGRFSVNYFARNADNLLVGWGFGAHALGFYKKAYDLFALSTTQLVASTSVVAVSALSRVSRQRAQFRRYLLGAMAVMAFLGMGIAGDLTLIGKDLILLLLGPGWAPAGQIFTYFAPGIGIMILYGTHGWIHLSIGKADRWFRWGIVESIVTIPLLVVGLHWGPQGMALAWCASFWILTFPAMSYAGDPIGLKAIEVLAVVWRYIVASLLAGAVSSLMIARLALLSNAPGPSGAALRVAFASASYGCLYVCAIIVLHQSLSPMRNVSRLLREMVSIAGAEQQAAQLSMKEESRV